MKGVRNRPARVAEETPQSIHDHAVANLSFIRATLEHAGSFTAVPGLGGVVMGVSALVAAFIAAQQATPRQWFAVWVIEALVALVIGGTALVRKIRRSAPSIDSMPFRRFLLAYLPGMIAGTVITFLLYSRGWYEPMPGVWLLLYGAAVTAGGAMSVRIVPIMGSLFMLLGLAALLTPASWGTFYMAGGFGGLHILFGYDIARKHGG
jgi:hypothetical protein